MTAIEQFIEDAIKGGYQIEARAFYGFESTKNTISQFPERVLLDPLAWQAVGKTRGWANIGCSTCHQQVLDAVDGYAECPEHGILVEDEYADYVWKMKWQGFINWLADGNSIEEALASLTPNSEVK